MAKANGQQGDEFSQLAVCGPIRKKTLTEKLRILILGASGQFGKRLCRRLLRLAGLRLFLGGRTRQTLEALRTALATEHPHADCDILQCNLADPGFPDHIGACGPDLVIHLAGPFQGQDYRVAKACLKLGASYIDMADGREFVTRFSALHSEAKEKGVGLVTGASTVPALSSAIADYYGKDFSRLERLDYGIAASLRTGLGAATLRAVLSYCGRPYEVLRRAQRVTVYGLGHPRAHDFPPPVGRRMIVDCDIPDHGLFPARYPSLRDIDFGSGVDIRGIARILSFMSFCARRRWLAGWSFLSGFVEPFMAVAGRFGSGGSGFFMRLEGADEGGKTKSLLLEILAGDDAGLEIPVTPPMLLVKRILVGQALPVGAYPCQGLLSLAEFRRELASYPITWLTNGVAHD